MPFSTHDWTENINLTNPFKESWADVKTPGGHQGFEGQNETRRTYVVGTIEVQRTGPSGFNPSLPLFSEFVAEANGLPVFDLAGPPPGTQLRRQVVMLQCNDAQDGIVWQRYFYGRSGNPLEVENFEKPNNARAVSVWAAERVSADELTGDPNTRIAICGETWDERLVESQAPLGWSDAGTSPSGFLAVYNGNGDLLWTHHFFAGSNPLSSCAITDLSIRVDELGDEIVTYCGIMTHGDPGTGTELSPVRPFASPGAGLSGGATTQGGGWDGFVGRLRRSGGVTTREFHSIVSGSGQDGLFGLAEITESRFAVVGSTSLETPGTSEFPITFTPLVAPYAVGVALVFDAAQVPGGNLVLDAGIALGADAVPEP